MQNLPLLAVLGLVAACCRNEPLVQQSSADLQINASLDAAMDRAAKASAAVAGIELASATVRERSEPAPPASALPSELKQRISVDWTGPLDSLVRAIADQIDYRMIESGPASAQPVMITMHRLDTPVWQVLRDAGIAVTTQALIVVDAQSRTLELRRPSVDR